MTRRRRIIQPKKPVYLGCEGESEVAYGQLLNDLLRSADLPVHLHVEALAPGAGDPLSRIERAHVRIAGRERRRARFRLKAILLDSDQIAAVPRQIAEAKRLASQYDIRLIWQQPCHEALLLRHMPNFSDRRPPTSQVAEQQLKRIWPQYEKPMARTILAERIDHAAVRRAAAVEPDLRAFLEWIGLMP